MKHQNTLWFSIILAMWLMLVLSFTGLYLIEYMIPFSRSIKGVENASQAFYEGYAWVENSLLSIYSGDIWDDYSDDFIWNQDFAYTVTASWSIIPFDWKWNSEYDSNWNKISQNIPISIFLGKNRLHTWWSDRIRFSLRVPDFDGDGNSENLKTSDGDDDIILWQLSSTTDSISSRSGSLITESDINLDIIETSLWSSTSLSEGITLDGTDRSFQWFYNNNSSECDDVNNECVLKISIINPLISDNLWSSTIPYLEYQIHTDTVIPLSQSYVTSEGKSYGFTKKLELVIPQQSTSSAFDFTVLQ